MSPDQDPELPEFEQIEPEAEADDDEFDDELDGEEEEEDIDDDDEAPDVRNAVNEHDNTPSADVPTHLPEEPLGNRGRDHEAWSPAGGEQGISARVMDEDPEAENETDPSKD